MDNKIIYVAAIDVEGYADVSKIGETTFSKLGEEIRGIVDVKHGKARLLNFWMNRPYDVKELRYTLVYTFGHDTCEEEEFKDWVVCPLESVKSAINYLDRKWEYREYRERREKLLTI